MPPSALGDFLRRPDVVDNDAELCVIYNNYNQTPMFLETVCPTHKNTKRTHIDDIITSDYVWSDDVIIVYIFYRSLSRQRCGGPRCLASGPWLSAAPRGQRSTHGLTNASKTTWSSSLRVWSAPVAHTTPPAWPSKNCMYCMVYTGLYCIYVYFLKNIEFFGIFCLFFWLFSNQVSGFILFFSVSLLGEYNYTAADFMRRDVFNTIRAYLTSGQPSH